MHFDNTIRFYIKKKLSLNSSFDGALKLQFKKKIYYLSIEMLLFQYCDPIGSIWLFFYLHPHNAMKILCVYQFSKKSAKWTSA